MLIDLVRPSVFVLVDECPRSLVVRSLREVGGDGGIWRYSIEKESLARFQNQVTSLKRDRTLARSGYEIAETRLPIETLIVSGDTSNGTSYTQAPRATDLQRFEVQTLRKLTSGKYAMWRAAIEVKWESRRWFISIQDVASRTEITALTTTAFQPGVTDEFPLDRVDPTMHHPNPPAGNGTVWGRLLAED